ncbi:MAG: molecular chaperone HtpG [Candidatus Cryptobacteroides sp.]|nr:molecular chaperone HtpG [Rikenellaceae bacterium]MDY5746449.1 molecular chaperone HtpG [Candidatus Cryptobacteroides sp.]
MATKSLKGKIGVTTENIFPVIKQFLYSDHEIFLRELVANAVDATQKMKALANSGDFKGELGELKVSVELDEKKKVLKVIDRGIGMTEEEVDKYINQIAFSSAGEFLEKYKDQIGSIIGHFGLGFYSAFMVSKKVTIETLSWKEGAKAVKWTCDGSPEYSMGESGKSDRGTVISLYLDDDSEEFASKGRISQLLGKYCKFMPVPVVFGKKTEWKDGKSVETDEDNVINNIEPIWTKAPSELKDEDYLKFYRELYPMEEEPMFWIHLNVDYPFTLTGVLYFPKIKERMAIDKNKIQLYCNQMFVTEHVDNIVPDFLTLLHGVIDSPDIPLNVSRSYLQSDANVKKISTYITKKVADRLEEIYKEQREQYEQKWDNIKLFIEYGMLSDEKFCERAMKFALLKNTEGKYFGLEDYRKAIESEQTDKDKNVVYLYATKPDEQYSFIEAAKNKGYDVLLMDCELDSHFVNLLESKVEHTRFARVDSDTIDKLIQKEEEVRPELSEDDKKALDEMFKSALPQGNEYSVEARNLGENAAPVVITQSEFMRRYREMSAMGGGMNFYGSIPESYNIVVNMENPLVARIWEARGSENAETELLQQVVDLALLGNGMLKGKALADFVARSEKLLNK